MPAFLFTLLCLCLAVPLRAAPVLLLPEQGIRPDQLAVVINENDALSVAVGELYARERDIPEERVVRLRFPANQVGLDAQAFGSIKAELDERLPSDVQALLLTWIKPYRVGCMSITSAFTFGFDRRYCSAAQCARTEASPYFDSAAGQPYTQLGIRPSMLLGARTRAEAEALIRRGIGSETAGRPGTAYLLSTSDRARNGRATFHDEVRKRFGRWIDVETPRTDRLEGKRDVMFYFTGVPVVEGIAGNRYLPGAVADHLTSFGGMLTDSPQMSALEWLKAGATGSYGTVVEPCAHLQKFPAPPVLMAHYLAGERLIEAYWKSVAWPGEGLFLGEPLARPFPGYFVREAGGTTVFELPRLAPGRYRLAASASAFGPYKPVAQLAGTGQGVGIRLPQPVRPYYRLERLPEPRSAAMSND